MTRSEWDNPTITTDLTTDITTDEPELTTEQLKEISAWLLAMLHVALERPTNKEWHQKWVERNEKKWKRLT